jgi:hypothetical protein
MRKPKIITKTIQRLAYESLNREQQKKVEEKFREYIGCSRSTFYKKLNGTHLLRPHEKQKFNELLKIEHMEKMLAGQ